MQQRSGVNSGPKAHTPGKRALTGQNVKQPGASQRQLNGSESQTPGTRSEERTRERADGRNQTGTPGQGRQAQACEWGAASRKKRVCSTLADRKKASTCGMHRGIAKRVPKPSTGTVERKTAPGLQRRRKACQVGARGTRNQMACSDPRPDNNHRSVTRRRINSWRACNAGRPPVEGKQ